MPYWIVLIRVHRKQQIHPDDKATLECTTSFDNEGQTASPQEDDPEEDDVHSLADPGDSATQAEREIAVAKIRPSVWVQDAADVRRIKQKQMPLGRVSESLVFNLFNPQQILEDILDLITSRLSTNVFIDCCTHCPLSAQSGSSACQAHVLEIQICLCDSALPYLLLIFLYHSSLQGSSLLIPSRSTPSLE